MYNDKFKQGDFMSAYEKIMAGLNEAVEHAEGKRELGEVYTKLMESEVESRDQRTQWMTHDEIMSSLRENYDL